MCVSLLGTRQDRHQGGREGGIKAANGTRSSGLCQAVISKQRLEGGRAELRSEIDSDSDVNTQP